MRKRIYFFTLVLLFLTGQVVNAQVTIGSNDDPHAGAVLELKSDKGFLLPRVSLTNATSFDLGGSATAAEGMVVYNLNGSFEGGKGVYVWNGAKWQAFGGETTTGGTAAPNIIMYPFTTPPTLTAASFSADWTVIIGYGGTPLTIKLPDLALTDIGKKITIDNRSGNGWLINYTNAAYADATPFAGQTKTIAANMGLTLMWCGSYWTTLARV